MNHHAYQISDVPQQVPDYVNEFFGEIGYQEDGLPVSVYGAPFEPIYFPVCFYGKTWVPMWHRPFSDPYACHKYWQEHTALTARVLLQHYSMNELYHEEFAKGIRLWTEELERDIKAGRETVL